jgi:hypothetical protein
VALGLVLLLPGGAVPGQSHARAPQAHAGIHKPAKQKDGLYGRVSENRKIHLTAVLIEVYDGIKLVATDSTDFEGMYHISGLPAGNYQVEATLHGYLKFREAGIVVVEGKSRELNFVMRPLNDRQAIGKIRVK